MITVVLAWAKSGLKSNLRASNLQNFPGGTYPHTPSQMSSAAAEEIGRKKSAWRNIDVEANMKCRGYAVRAKRGKNKCKKKKKIFAVRSAAANFSKCAV